MTEIVFKHIWYTGGWLYRFSFLLLSTQRQVVFAVCVRQVVFAVCVCVCVCVCECVCVCVCVCVV
jgi:hypothetical protein